MPKESGPNTELRYARQHRAHLSVYKKQAPPMHRPSFSALPPLRTTRHALAAALLIACLGPSSVAASETTITREQLLAQARQKRDAQQWQDALQDFRQGQARFPDEPAFRDGEIYVLADAGQPEQAYAKAAQLLQRRPDDADTF